MAVLNLRFVHQMWNMGMQSLLVAEQQWHNRGRYSQHQQSKRLLLACSVMSPNWISQVLIYSNVLTAVVPQQAALSILKGSNDGM
jgi:hypothetical protein